MASKKLTDSQLRAIKPSNSLQSLADGEGLVLLCKDGKCVWRYRYRFLGKAQSLTIGSYPQTTLASARTKHQAMREQLLEGLNPSRERKNARRELKVSHANSFQAVAQEWLEVWSRNKSPDHVKRMRARLENNLFPELGELPISSITHHQLRDTLKMIEGRGALSMLKRAHQAATAIFAYAVEMGKAPHNVGRDITAKIAFSQNTERNFARVTQAELPQLLRDIDNYTGIAGIALQLLAHTFTRPVELTSARWNEIDLDKREWRIPAERTKMRRPHLVQMSYQVHTLFSKMHNLTAGREFVFPNGHDPSRPLSNGALLGALKRMGYRNRQTAHGFRGLASTILHEQGYDHEVIETQLAHAREKVSAAYNHSSLLPQRARMLQKWSDYLDSLKALTKSTNDK